MSDDIMKPTMVTDADMRLVHTHEFVEKIKAGTLSPQEQRVLEVPLSAELREAMWFCAGGTLLTAARALDHAVSVHLGGGFHHAFPAHGEGFCLINDVAVAIHILRRDKVIERALVIDLDVHHGNGTAAIFAEVPAVFTFSMHQQHNYPSSKPPSDQDIGLEDGTDDDAYIGLLDEQSTKDHSDTRARDRLLPRRCRSLPRGSARWPQPDDGRPPQTRRNRLRPRARRQRTPRRHARRRVRVES